MKEQNHHQAEQLEKMIQEVKQHSGASRDNNEESQQLFQPEINVLDLPPRREIHQKDDRRFKFKMSRATGRLFFIIVILLIVVSAVVYDLIYGNRLFNFNTINLIFDKYIISNNHFTKFIKEFIIDNYTGG